MQSARGRKVFCKIGACVHLCIGKSTRWSMKQERRTSSVSTTEYLADCMSGNRV